MQNPWLVVSYALRKAGLYAPSLSLDEAHAFLTWEAEASTRLKAKNT